MINRLLIRNYKALRDVDLKLTRIHALIGPNDSGKTSILYALAAISRSTDYQLQQAFLGTWEGRELVWHGNPDGVIGLSVNMSEGNRKLEYSLACRFANSGRTVVVQEEKIRGETEIECNRRDHGSTSVFGVCISNEPASEQLRQACQIVHMALSGVHYYRWNPRMLALPVAPDSARRFRMNSDGFGLALFLDDILGYDRKRFGELEEKFCKIFPEVSSIKLSRQMAFRSPLDDLEQVSRINQADGKGLYFEFRGDKQLVPAAHASDGVLLILAYLAVLFSPEPPRILLIEEPENGIHPKRLGDVLGILRELVVENSQTQVVLTTHSPYAVDLFKDPSDVTLCTKGNDGAVVLTRMSDSTSVKEQLSIFNLGEIWTAEGDDSLSKEHAASSS